jgi:cytochrome c-type biogenesis protein CcmH
VALLPLQQAQGPLAGQGEVGTLREPGAAGRPRAPTEIADYDERIKAIEHRLACSCGCTLDIFTCRTTDFTCTYSPELHREVVELDRAGKTAQEILDAFVAKYGEKALMAPKPEGFNLWGYLLPGSAILLAGGALVAFISRRRVAVAKATAAGAPPVRSDTSVSMAETAPAVNATPEEMERLRRALAEVED